MRIELNSGGLSGLIAIAEFGLCIKTLDDNIEDMISSFQTVKKAADGLEGGVGLLGETLNDLQERIKIEQDKRDDLKDFVGEFNDFLNLALNMDKQAALCVDQNKEEFYRLNEHLRPVIDVDDGGWHPLRDLTQALSDLGEWIVEGIVEIWDEVVLVAVGVALVVGGIVLVAFSAGTALLFIGGITLIVGGVGWGIGGWRTRDADGNVDFGQAFKGLIFGSIAGAAVGATLYAVAYFAVLQTNVILGGMVEGFGTNVAMDFFSQTVLDGDDVASFRDYDLGQTLYEGFMGAIISGISAGVFDATGAKTSISKWLGNKLGKTISNPKLLKVLSGTLGNFINGCTDEVLEYGFDWASGKKEEFSLWEIIHSGLQDLAFGMLGDAVSYDIDAKKASKAGGNGPGPDGITVKDAGNVDPVADDIDMEATRERVLKNIEESKAAREASNFGTTELSYEEYTLSSKNAKRFLKNRGWSDEAADEVIQSFTKYADGADLPDMGDVSVEFKVRHTPPEGMKGYVYSTMGDASGIYVTPVKYLDNGSGISSMALPPSNAMLRGEEVIVKGDILMGTIAPQPSFTAAAKAGLLDDIDRIGGGIQIVTNGGFKTGAVIKTGVEFRLWDTANRVKLLEAGD